MSAQSERLGGVILSQITNRLGRALTVEEVEAIIDQADWNEENVTNVLAPAVERIEGRRVWFTPTICIAWDGPNADQGQWVIEDVDWMDSAGAVDYLRGDVEEAYTTDSRFSMPTDLVPFYESACQWADKHLDVIVKETE